ncbi:MAG: hypothetical protein KDH89_22735 [Anaerolineae bacterium]|nr:hypothetical protein [Anaerolineae bacterium]
MRPVEEWASSDARLALARCCGRSPTEPPRFHPWLCEQRMVVSDARLALAAVRM